MDCVDKQKLQLALLHVSLALLQLEYVGNQAMIRHGCSCQKQPCSWQSCRQWQVSWRSALADKGDCTALHRILLHPVYLVCSLLTCWLHPGSCSLLDSCCEVKESVNLNLQHHHTHITTSYRCTAETTLSYMYKTEHKRYEIEDNYEACWLAAKESALTSC